MRKLLPLLGLILSPFALFAQNSAPSGAFSSSGAGGGNTSGQVTNGIPVNTNGTATALNAVVCTPPIVNGVYSVLYNVTASISVVPTCPLTGLSARGLAGAASSDTTLYSDNNNAVEYAGSAAVAISLPTPTSLLNAAWFGLADNFTTGANTALTWTPAGGFTANGSATFTQALGQQCGILLDPNVASNWLFRCTESPIVAGTGIVLTRAAHSLTISATSLLSGTTGFFPKFTSSTNIGNSLCDEGVTSANTMTCVDSAGLVIQNALVQQGSTPPAVIPGSAGGKFCNEGTAPTGTPAASDGFYCSGTFQAMDAVNHNVDEGPYLTASRNLIWNANQAAQSQVVVSGTEYYITHSDLDMPAIYRLAIGAGTTLHWRIALTKTAAGTGTFQINLKKGTAGSIADSTSATITIGTQTAAADNMEADITITFTSATAYYWSVIPRQSAASATGFGLVYPAAAAQFTGTVSGLTTTTASDKYGLSVIFTTGTPTFVVNEVYATANGVL